MRLAFERVLETRLVERPPGGVLGFGDAVAVDGQHIIRLDRHVAGRVRRVLEHAERDAAVASAVVQLPSARISSGGMWPALT